ncbi:nucleoside hydrolase [Oscillatoria sp. FACHB-1406]|uniref:nucleoside hydrolase n=1 Tax=Oscillatoria sp. FACHB-1406 TaxID=2692846 RepID=UPI0016859B3B|nr:nucleoside hydrolase [Oscillatoria sp. FACHB-1406]MBD2578994.1 nucleoside hydrolase [Oscillatoria sp. FACHB-1406]
MSKKLVLMDQDGAIDDFLATILLMTMEQFQPLGVIVTPADCYIESALQVTRKILDLMQRTDIPVVESRVRGINPFPSVYRRDCITIDHFPILNQQETIETPLARLSGAKFMVKVLEESSEPVSLIVTGPLTTLAEAIAVAPHIEPKIERLVWMGGALEVPGNVEKNFAPEHDGSAEWNAFWDPLAVDRVWKTQIPIFICPLDITNTVPVTSEFIHKLAKQRHHPISELAGLCYALALPQNYYCWDVLATAYLARPELYRLEEYETEIVTAGRSQGQVKVRPGGRPVRVVRSVDREAFYDYLLEQWAR